MSELEPTASTPVDVEPVPAAPSEKKSFLSAGSSKVVIIAAALGALAVIAGIVIVLVVFVFGKSVADQVDVTIDPSPPAATVETTETVASGPAEAVANAEVFTFRDIFEPLIVLSVDTTTTTTSDPDTANTTTTGTLYLTRTFLQDSAWMAEFSLDGVTYTLGDGDRVGDSPWQVVTVSDGSAVMLFGDTRVVLTVGQGITK
jgi:hypothetical protein